MGEEPDDLLNPRQLSPDEAAELRAAPVHSVPPARSEPACVCGHPKERHFGGNLCTQRDNGVYCECPRFRACVSWPTSEGLWKSNANVPAGWCLAISLSTEIVVKVFGDTRTYKQSDFPLLGPPRFVKCTEPNPFA
jgi:hypothetical protein